MRKRVIFLTMLFTFFSIIASYALTAGDIAIIGVNTDAAKSMVFVALADIPANTTITFSDNAWDATNQLWRTGEASIAWSNTELTAKGAVIVVSMGAPTSPFTVNIGSVTTNTNFNLATSGDQILAYEGTTAPTTNDSALWLFGFSTENWVWGNNSNTSDIPTALVGASVAMTTSTTEVDNAYFANGTDPQTTITLTGTKSELLALFTNGSLYYKNDTGPLTFPTYSITVSAGVSATITVDPATLTGFTYAVGNGPSTPQTFTISGVNLTNNISIAASANYEISLSSGSGYTTPIVLTQSGGSVAETTIYVRLKAGLTAGTYNDESITATSDPAIPKSVICSGSVTTSEPANHVTNFAAGAPTSTTITVTWTDSDASGYLIKASNVSYESIVAPVDGTPEVDATLVKNVAAGIGTKTFTGLTSSTAYYFKIYPYNNSGTAIDYKVDGIIPQATATTLVGPSATIILRPSHIDISAVTAESAVKVNLSNYTTDDVRYRLYNGTSQYNCWNEDNDTYVTSFSYGDGPAVPGTPTTSSTFWIMSQRGGNISTAASYRDRLGPTYPANNLTVALPAATEITTPFTLSGTFSGTMEYPLTSKYVVLAYSGTTLVSAASTALSTGALSVVCPDGTTIDKIEIRTALDVLVAEKTGSWSTTTNVGSFGETYPGQIIVDITGLVPFTGYANVIPSTYQTYSLTGDNLNNFIELNVTGPFQIASADNPTGWDTYLQLSPQYNDVVLVRYMPIEAGSHDGTITHTCEDEAAPVYVELSGTATTLDPAISVTPSTMSFSVAVGSTTVQSATISSANQTQPINIALASAGPFTFSATEEGTYASTLQLSANYNGTFWIKFTPTAIETYNNTITLQSGIASDDIIITGYGLDPNATYATDLFFSEYTEAASGNNKVIELFNGTGASVDLSSYVVKLASNGGAWSTTNIAILSGSLANNDVFVIANASSTPDILAIADITSSVTFFNGDDALGLFKNDVLIDVIGVQGVDPGTAWNVAGVTNATADHTLIRKPTIESPTTDWTLSAGTNAEDSQWIVLAWTDNSDLGSHTFTPGVAVAAAPIIQPTEGLYTSPLNVTMSTTTTGGVIWYTLDNTEPTNSAPSIQYTGQFQITATTTVKAKTFADGFLPSVTASAHYIIPLEVATIAELRNGTAGVYYRYTGVGVLTFQQTFRHQKYIQDATAGILIDDNLGLITTVYNLYDGLTEIVGTVAEFGGMKQFTPYDDPGAPYSTGNSVIPQVITLSELVTNFENYESELVKVTGITFDTADGILAFANGQMYPMNSGLMNFRTTFYDVDYIGTVVPMGTLNIIGIPNSRVTEGNLFNARFLADFEMAGALDTPVAAIYLEDGSVKLSWAAITGATGYKVYAADDPEAVYPGGWTLITPTPITGTVYTYTGMEGYKFFKVTANN